ncbi:hypothetical protein IMW63_00910 [Ehrlichia ruminantium]|uniref:hypothetical protein n=1 Tax=Ehrlichia ruminantium TaxID=779 RepID=UPI001FB4ED02|nr:hypothetical protein [Ehrlichia ruminantium]UOD98944.1 hypothetical protein IMW63_00910 [Ehrlichia ruminantium]
MKVQVMHLLEQIRVMCLLMYTIGAMLFILKYCSLINQDFKLVSNWLVGISVVLFLTLSFAKLMCDYFCKFQNREGKELLNRNQVKNLISHKSTNSITTFRHVGNTILVSISIFSGCLLVINNSLSMNKELVADVYGVWLIIGIVFVGLYIGFRVLGACLGICSNFAENMDMKNIGGITTELVVQEIASQLSSSFDIV